MHEKAESRKKTLRTLYFLIYIHVSLWNTKFSLQFTGAQYIHKGRNKFILNGLYLARLWVVSGRDTSGFLKQRRTLLCRFKDVVLSGWSPEQRVIFLWLIVWGALEAPQRCGLTRSLNCLVYQVMYTYLEYVNVFSSLTKITKAFLIVYDAFYIF